MSLLQQSWVQDSAHWEPFSQNTYCESPVHLAAQESQELIKGPLEFCLTTKPHLPNQAAASAAIQNTAISQYRSKFSCFPLT